MTETDDCPEAVDFHSVHSNKRSADGLAAAICGTTNVLANGPFHNFRLANGVPKFPFTSQDVVRAMNTVTQFASTNAALFRLSPAQAGTAAATVFGLAWIHYMNNKDISTENLIPANDLQGTQTVTSACTTASIRQCSVSCGFLGDLFRCNTACVTATNCGATSVLTTITTTQWTPPPAGATGTGCVASDYIPVTTVWPVPTTSMVDPPPSGTQCFCQCPASSMAPLYWGTNTGRTTSSFCLGASPTNLPKDFTLIKGIGCAPSSTTATAPATSTSKQFCSSESRYLAGPVLGDVQLEQAKAFCSHFMTPFVFKPDTKQWLQHMKVDAIYYSESISWINYQNDRCKDASLSQPAVGVDECVDIFYRNWKNCKPYLYWKKPTYD